MRDRKHLRLLIAGPGETPLASFVRKRLAERLRPRHGGASRYAAVTKRPMRRTIRPRKSAKCRTELGEDQHSSGRHSVAAPRPTAATIYNSPATTLDGRKSRAVHRDHLLPAADSSPSRKARIAGPRRQQARRWASAAARTQLMSTASGVLGAIATSSNLIGRSTKDHAAGAQLHKRAAGRVGADVASRVATEVKALAVQTQNATEEISRKIDALQKDAAGSVDAVHRISQAIEAIRPVFEIVNGAVAEQTETTGEISDNAATASSFIVAVGESAAEIDHVTKQAEAHGESVASAGKAVTIRAQRVALRSAAAQDERNDPQDHARPATWPWKSIVRAACPLLPPRISIAAFDRGPDAATAPINLHALCKRSRLPDRSGIFKAAPGEFEARCRAEGKTPRQAWSIR